MKDSMINRCLRFDLTAKAKLKSKQKQKSKKEIPESKEIVVPKLKSKTFNLQEWSKLGIPDFMLKALEENKFDDPTPIQVSPSDQTVHLS